MSVRICSFGHSLVDSRFKDRCGLSEKVRKGEWWMPRLIQAMKDVISCDK